MISKQNKELLTQRHRMVGETININGVDEAIELVILNTDSVAYCTKTSKVVVYPGINKVEYFDIHTGEYLPNMKEEPMVDRVVDWIKRFVGDKKVVIGISGGKDSTVVLKLLIEAVGRDRIYAVTMPHKENGIEPEVFQIAKEFDIEIHITDIRNTYLRLTDALEWGRVSINQSGNIDKDLLFKNKYCIASENPVYTSNTPCRLRMTTLYSIAALLGNALVVCTDNASERYIGWSTKWGDNVGDFAPILNFTVREVKQLGYDLGIPENLIEKKPSDGMCGATDEDKFGFTYDELDDYILNDKADKKTIDKITKMYYATKHKRDAVNLPTFNPEIS